jgi:putative nucleotidyltransferase with HDIG domain
MPTTVLTRRLHRIRPKAVGPSRKLAIGAATFVALALATGLQYLTPPLELRVGQVSPRDVEAPRSVEFVDRVRTDALRREAAEAIRPVTRLSPEATDRAREAVSRTFAAIDRTRAVAGLSFSDRAALLRQQAPVALDDPAVLAALTLDAPALAVARATAEQAVLRVMEEGVRPEDLPRAQAEVRAMIRAVPIAGRTMTLASAVALAALQPNLVVDLAATQALRRRAMEDVTPVTTRILRGEVVVRRGEVVTEAHMHKLAALGLVRAPWSWQRPAGVALVVLLLLVVSGAYLRQFQPDIWAQDRLLLVWSLAVVLTVAMARLLVGRVNPYVIPTGAGVVLIAVLLRPRLALYTAAVVSLLVATVAGGDVRLGVVTFVGSTVGVYAIKRISHRTDLMVAGVWVGAAGALAAAALTLVDQLPWYPDMVTDMAHALGNGLLVGIIAIGTLPYLEHVFGLVTPIKLLELSNPSHPLLRRLQVEAPGTYHHSLIVANLAEAAAEAVGADSLLVRVGAYYHDVGKIRRPAFFVENQAGLDNPHDRMTPSLSALTVLSHVRDGLEYAREYRLPSPVADFIAQHHGTNLMTYFYHQAVQRGDAVCEDAFRYDGPKPQTRETAIVMLADAVEGATRALTRPTPDRIEQTVRRIIREKLDDGQLDQCDLTFRDLDVIARVFVRLLATMFHPRVEYPDLERDLRTGARDRSAPVR